MSEPARSWLSPMRARSADEPHRVSTPLELLFDLCFVVAVAQAAAPLHHAVTEHHFGHAGNFLMVFFAIWWAWMNFTWFASAYDTDDDVYRITTLVQIVGALVLAAGIEPAFDHGNFTAVTWGYVVMRLAVVVQWLRAAHADPQRRATALRYAAGTALVQVLWLVRLVVPYSLAVPAFLLLAVAEMAVPIWAERAPGGPTTYHPHHIAERYGLFTIIVLGETISAATIAFQAALDGHGERMSTLLPLAVSGLVVVFSLWWLYFDRSAHGLLTSMRTSILWGYGHYFIFASAAATGAGLAVVVDHANGQSEISGTVTGYAVAIPVAVYLFFVWLLHIRPHQRGPLVSAYPVVAVLCLVAPLLPGPVVVLAVLLTALVGVTITVGRRIPDPVG